MKLEVFEPGDDKEKSEAWYIKRIAEALEGDNLDHVLKELVLAWKDGYQITDSNLRVENEETELAGASLDVSIFDALCAFFDKKIEENKLTVEERIKLFNLILPHDFVLAAILIERKYSESEEVDVYKNAIVNPEELYGEQEKFYEWLIDKEEPLEILHTKLTRDGCIGENSFRQLPETLRNKIVAYARKTEEWAREGYAKDQAKHWTWKIEEAGEIIKTLG